MSRGVGARIRMAVTRARQPHNLVVAGCDRQVECQADNLIGAMRNSWINTPEVSEEDCMDARRHRRDGRTSASTWRMRCFTSSRPGSQRFPAPLRIRTCGTTASGSSAHGFAADVQSPSCRRQPSRGEWMATFQAYESSPVHRRLLRAAVKPLSPQPTSGKAIVGYGR